MSRGVNKAIIIGTLGRDPEVRYTGSGTAVATINVATNESWKDKQTGEQMERTEWHRIIVWGKLAEICSQYLKKGSQAYFEGRIQTKKWQDQSGADRYSTEINAHEMQMLGGKPQSHDNTDHRPKPQEAPQERPQQQSEGPPMDRNGQSTAPMDDGFDDIPF